VQKEKLFMKIPLAIVVYGIFVAILSGCTIPVQPPPPTQATPTQAAATIVAAKPPPAPTMVRIPAGAYTIGSTQADDTEPVHQVTLAAFNIDRYEVTNAQFAEFLNALNIQPLRDAAAGAVRSDDLPATALSLLLEGVEGSQQSPLIALDDEHARIAIQAGRFVAQPGYENHPVTESTWRGAVEYCAWRGARLPTEAEWEAAARGVDGRVYPWGDELPTPERAVYGRGSGATAPVGAHPDGATPAGIADLAGNVAEWTSTLYQPYPYDPADGREAPETEGERVTRGGDHVFDSAPEQLTTFFRGGFSRAPDRGHRHIGFRCAQTAP